MPLRWMDEMPKIQKQDWLSHFINFTLMFLGVVLGISLTSNHEVSKSKRDASGLLEQMYNDSQSTKCLMEGTISYFNISQMAAIDSLKAWNDSADMTDRKFVNSLIKASQIITPPRTLDNYKHLFGKEELKYVNKNYESKNGELSDVRRELVKFFSYDTDIFKYEALISTYRKNINEAVLYAVKNTYCPDTESEIFGKQHGTECSLVSQGNMDEIATAIRGRMDIFEQLTEYTSDLNTLRQHLTDYKNNIVALELVIKGTNPTFGDLSTCIKHNQ